MIENDAAEAKISCSNDMNFCGTILTKLVYDLSKNVEELEPYVSIFALREKETFDENKRRVNIGTMGHVDQDKKY